jgi:EAL and modified HD-GYP domain-containing signal transduction protein
VVLEVLENVVVDDQLLDALRGLRERGFKLAADDFIGEVDRWALVPFVDVVKVDALALRTPLKPLVAAIHDLHPTVELLAERIEQTSELPEFYDAGFTLFQGYAFAKPAVIMQTRMSPTQLVCVRLLRALADPESSVPDLERILAADPGLSLRVLRTANSTQSGLLSKVSSLHQAVVLLGPVVLSAWVVLTLMGGLGSGRRSDLVSVLSRAVACEQLAIDSGQDQSQAYTAGLLSGIAAVLGSSPREVAVAAGLDGQMIAAIEHGTGAIGALLRAVECHERDDDAGLTLTSVSPFDVSRAYLTGLSSALNTVDGVLGQEE